MPDHISEAIAEVKPAPAMRAVTIFAGDDGRLAYTLGDPEEAIIRTEVPAVWDAEALTQLCRRLGAMRDGQLERLAQRIGGR